MADLSYFHGVKVEESATAPVALRISQQGATFVNGTAPDADPAAFPINQPRLITSLAQAASLGAAGTVRSDVESILGEGGSYVLVNLVEHSADAAIQEANLIGDASARTGLYSALRAKALLGIQPRVIVTAGNTGAFIDGGLLSIAISNQGAKLTEPPTVQVTGGGEDPAKVMPVLAVVMGAGDDADKVISVTVVKPGKNMTQAPVIAFEGGGTGTDKIMPIATANIGDVANAFVSALNTICPKIRARAYISGPNTTNAEAIRWRKTINSDRILCIDPLAIKNVAGVPVPRPIAPVFAGVRARVVASGEGVSGSVSNKIIRTIDGVARTITYPEDSNYLNENHVSTVINERGGLRTWGSRLATDSTLWHFDSVRATADMINEALEDLYFQYVDRKFTKANLKHFVEDGNAALRDFQLNEDILGGRAWLSASNTPSLNAQGKVFLDVEFEPVGLMEQIHVTTHRNILYYQVMLDQVNGLIENGPLTLGQ